MVSYGDEFVWVEGFVEVDGKVGRGDNVYVGYVMVDDGEWDREFVEYVEGDGVVVGFGFGRVLFEEEGFDVVGG